MSTIAFHFGTFPSDDSNANAALLNAKVEVTNSFISFRRKLIHQHFRSQAKEYQTISPIVIKGRSISSSRVLCRVVKDIFLSKSFWKIIAATVAVVTAGCFVGMFVFSTYQLYRENYELMKIGQFFIEQRKVTWGDFYSGVAFLTFIDLKLSFVWMAAVKNMIYNPCKTFSTQIQSFYESAKHRYEILCYYEKVPSSMKDCNLNQLANQHNAEGWEDIITLETIPSSEIYAPPILLIGQYAIKVENALRSMLTKDCGVNHRLPHPIENREMIEEEHRKFLTDIGHLVGLQPHHIQSCWTLPNVVCNPPQFIPAIENLLRIIKFLEMIPSNPFLYQNLLSDENKSILRDFPPNFWDQINIGSSRLRNLLLNNPT